MAVSLTIAQDPAADRVLSEDPFALLVGMLLDQQYPMEHAFAGPSKILARFGSLDPGRIAAADPDAFADLCATPPAITATAARWPAGCRLWPPWSARATRRRRAIGPPPTARPS